MKLSTTVFSIFAASAAVVSAKKSKKSSSKHNETGTAALNLTDTSAPLNITTKGNATFINGTNLTELAETNKTNVTVLIDGKNVTKSENVTELTGAVGLNYTYDNTTLIIRETLTELVTVPTRRTTIRTNGATYTASANETLTISDCPCVVTRRFIKNNDTAQATPVTNETRRRASTRSDDDDEEGEGKNASSDSANGSGKLVPAIGLAQLVMMLL